MINIRKIKNISELQARSCPACPSCTKYCSGDGISSKVVNTFTIKANANESGVLTPFRR